MKKLSQAIKYIATFCISVFLLFGIITASALIPRDKIQDNMRESADYLCERAVFFTVLDNVKPSNIDRYADSILLNIAYHFDEKDPINSVMWSSYYFRDDQNENDNLRDAVVNDLPANQQYLRYWHGSIAIVRVLMLFMNLKQIYIFNGVVIALLSAALIWALCRNHAKSDRRALVFAFIAGMAAVSIWFVPFSLEYTWMFIWMLIVSLMLVVKVDREGKVKSGPDTACTDKNSHGIAGMGKVGDSLGYLFLISGIVAPFLDFLTTETITLTVPLLILVYLMSEDKARRDIKAIRITVIRNSILWGIGYVCMWVMKWIVAGVILHENVMPYVREHVSERLAGDINVSFPMYLLGSLGRNISCLFPFSYGAWGIFAGIVLVIGLAYIAYVYKKKSVDRSLIGVYLLIGFIPYVRFLVLLNHSYIHYFFTFRAQIVTVMALVLSVLEMSEWKRGKV